MVFFMGAEPGGSGNLMSCLYFWFSKWKNFDLSRALMQKYSFISGCSCLIFALSSSERLDICLGSIFIDRFIGASSLYAYSYHQVYFFYRFFLFNNDFDVRFVVGWLLKSRVRCLVEFLDFVCFFKCCHKLWFNY